MRNYITLLPGIFAAALSLSKEKKEEKKTCKTLPCKDQSLDEKLEHVLAEAFLHFCTNTVEFR